MMKMLMVLLSGALAFVAAPAEAKSCKSKEVVNSFTDLFYVKHKVREAFETWVAPGYIQHNPMTADGRDAAIAFLEPFLSRNPTMSNTIKHVIAEGDLVVIHQHVKSAPYDRGRAIIDIYRVEKCRIVEHWDVIQPVPENSANPHPMF